MQTGTKLKPFFENISFEKENADLVVNLGPQHASAHGQLRIIIELDGEMIRKANFHIGFMHRGMEKMAENMIYQEFIPTTDRMDYISAVSGNHSYALAVERLLGIDVPRRAKVIRMILLEIGRLVSHIFWLGTFALDIGAMSMFLYTLRLREYFMDLFDDYIGSRFMHSCMRIGGVPLDLPEDFMVNLERILERVPKFIEMYEGLLNTNRIWRTRTQNIANITPEMAKDYACTGIMLRGSGIAYDIRKEEPYELYNEIDFKVPVSNSQDAYGRYKLYIEEMKEAPNIIRQVMNLYEGTDKELMADVPEYISRPKANVMTENYSLQQHFSLVAQGIKPPVGEVYSATETGKGEFGYFIRSEGDGHSYRTKIRAASFHHTSMLNELLPGNFLTDLPVIVSTTNLIVAEVDR